MFFERFRRPAYAPEKERADELELAPTPEEKLGYTDKENIKRLKQQADKLSMLLGSDRAAGLTPQEKEEAGNQLAETLQSLKASGVDVSGYYRATRG
jgi:hypothetical protein